MLSFLHYPIAPLLAAAAVALDGLLGEPRRWHPLVGFGRMASWIEARLNPVVRRELPSQKIFGVIGVALLIVPPILLAAWLCRISSLFDVFLLYFAIGHKSLHEHAWAVSRALENGDEAAARQAASYMVSRDSSALEPVSATVESVLENGNDGVFGALFWFLLLGGAGALLFRFANTLDAMWGYKNARFLHYGWAAARLDDVLDYVPARLTAATYAVLGNTRTALRSWRLQAPQWDSPNAGPVMAAGAGALGVQLGGPACYQGEWHQRPRLGEGMAATAVDIGRALGLVRHGVYLWLVVALALGTFVHA
ncbi:adenosylcobinamide-phosphate synthase [Novimethylophilus kurashikiensis]|uniref:Cobalamin biosynthesis protein CobD n=1 Tax=Novimethylophilus kurashikiensis TaxID=1825523 RepID=A0A2R5F6C6_9PROT|nr:adenosylcobinamide-phosphate synthase CbiB [Novimethylophilus kurashikiensis]GBG13830.1 adenosylcobinamide-phosphate synthase [Novimethylophilus kurashikiensis]